MKKKQIVIRIILIIAIIALLVYITKELWPIFAQIATEMGRIEFKEDITSLGFKGIILILGLIIAQVLIPILPGEPIEILAGMCLGTMGGLFIVLVGALCSTLLIIGIVKVFGKQFIYVLLNEKTIKKIENFETNVFNKNEKRIYSIFFLLFFIPGIPKDIIIYIAAILPINVLKFTGIATFARIPSILTSTIAGANLVEGNWLITIAVYVLMFIIAISTMIIVNKKDKEFIKTVDKIR